MPHGCEGEATLKVRVQIPEGVIAVKPMPKAGWTLETVTATYAQPYDYYGTPMTEGVTEIIWTGELPDAFYDEFVFRGMLTGGLEAGSALYFPVVQECADGAERWIEIPAAGPGPGQLEYPGARPEAAARRRRTLTRPPCGRSRSSAWSRPSSAGAAPLPMPSSSPPTRPPGRWWPRRRPRSRSTFSEPVRPLAARWFLRRRRAGRGRAAAEGERGRGAGSRRASARGTLLLSWRVVSADGHPVGGSHVFSIGAPTAAADARRPPARRGPRRSAGAC